MVIYNKFKVGVDTSYAVELGSSCSCTTCSAIELSLHCDAIFRAASRPWAAKLS